MNVKENTVTLPKFANRELWHRMARANIRPSALGETYRGDREVVVGYLNEALATQLVCALRYRRHHFMARGLASQHIAEELLLHSDEELAHADQLADRIVQLGGEPDFSPQTLTRRSRAEYLPAISIAAMLKENLAAERSAIEDYRSLIESLGENDPTTRRMLEGILGVGEAHADELAQLLQDVTRGN